MEKFLKFFLIISLVLNVFLLFQLNSEKNDVVSEDLRYASISYGISNLSDHFDSISNTFEFYGAGELPSEKELLLIEQAIDTHTNNIRNTRSHLVHALTFNNMSYIDEFEETLLNIEKLLGDFVYGGPFYKSEMETVQELLNSASQTIKQTKEQSTSQAINQRKAKEISDEMIESITEELIKINEQINSIYQKRS
ncbi:hypothetical protein BKP35_13245 [Anaerobacillus arseniciselenatis]|uniref:Uncharacterized protein n=1 Tax=Anaerobacillus arseniciselenatis TaxID=85682 RepID=A0A1S2LDR5_9BACI|nr:hypothetical protein [Anaerobacillus arseniciselenatis]OIJ10649.1 hypothetical protein BKP35_13245 [Anaerobacillus arseniciselenatis]